MRTPLSRIETVAGLLVAIAMALVAAAIVGSLSWGRILQAFRPPFVLYVLAPSADGARVGSPVRLRDVDIGVVVGVDLVDDPKYPDRGVRVTLHVQPEMAPFLHDKTEASLLRPPLGSEMPPFGSGAILLRSQGEHPLSPGATLLGSSSPSMVDDLASMVHMMESMYQEIASMRSSIATDLADLHVLVSALTQGDGLASRLLSDRSWAQSVEGTIAQTHAAMEKLNEAAQGASALTQKLGPVVDDTRGTISDTRALVKQLNDTAEGVPKLIAMVERTLKQTEELMGTLRVASTYAPELVRKVDNSLDEANRVVQAAERNVLLRATLPDATPKPQGAEVRPMQGP